MAASAAPRLGDQAIRFKVTRLWRDTGYIPYHSEREAMLLAANGPVHYPVTKLCVFGKFSSVGSPSPVGLAVKPPVLARQRAAIPVRPSVKNPSLRRVAP